MYRWAPRVETIGLRRDSVSGCYAGLCDLGERETDGWLPHPDATTQQGRDWQEGPIGVKTFLSAWHCDC
jgi:hypothetical protein